MRPSRLAMVTTWIVSAWLALAVVAAAPGADDAHAMLAAANAERHSRGLPALELNERLTRAAAAQAHDLVRTHRLDHTGSDGSRVGDRAERAGYRWSHIAENLAQTRSGSAETVVEQWMRSRPHRANLLNSAYRDLGVAHERDVWVIVLGRK